MVILSSQAQQSAYKFCFAIFALEQSRERDVISLTVSVRKLLLNKSKFFQTSRAVVTSKVWLLPPLPCIKLSTIRYGKKSIYWHLNFMVWFILCSWNFACCIYKSFFAFNCICIKRQSATASNIFIFKLELIIVVYALCTTCFSRCLNLNLNFLSSQRSATERQHEAGNPFEWTRGQWLQKFRSWNLWSWYEREIEIITRVHYSSKSLHSAASNKEHPSSKKWSCLVVSLHKSFRRS